MSKIIPFKFESHCIQVVTDGSGEPWFIAKEVASLLGYSEASAMTRHLDDDEKGLSDMQTLGGKQKVIIISESGLYSAILRSERVEAKRFKKWVTSEVLPSIRKTGGYRSPSPVKVVTEAARAFPPLFRAARLLGCDKNAAAISANQAVMAVTQINLLQQLGQTHLEAKNQEARFFTPTELGQMMGGVSGRKVNLLLAEAGLQAKRGDDWEALEAGQEFARIYDTGKKHGSGVAIQQVKWASNVISLLQQEDAA